MVGIDESTELQKNPLFIANWVGLIAAVYVTTNAVNKDNDV